MKILICYCYCFMIMQVKNGSGCSLGLQSGVAHLRKALHKYPNSCLLRYFIMRVMH